MSRLLAITLLIAACAPEPPPPGESEGQPSWDGTWAAAHGARIVQEDGQVFVDHRGHHLLAAEAVGSPALSADGSRLALAHRGGPVGLSVIDAVTISADGVDVRRRVEGGSPDRVAIDPGGDWIVYVNGTTGLASVWAVPFRGGEPVQLTNVGLVAGRGEPEGFVPPPHRGPLRVLGDTVRWTAPDGEHSVALP